MFPFKRWWNELQFVPSLVLPEASHLFDLRILSGYTGQIWWDPRFQDAARDNKDAKDSFIFRGRLILGVTRSRTAPGHLSFCPNVDLSLRRSPITSDHVKDFWVYSWLSLSDDFTIVFQEPTAKICENQASANVYIIWKYIIFSCSC